MAGWTRHACMPPEAAASAACMRQGRITSRWDRPRGRCCWDGRPARTSPRWRRSTARRTRRGRAAASSAPRTPSARRDQKECRTARTRRRGPSDAADGRRGPGPAVRSGPARAPAASCTTTPYQPMERVAAAAFAARSKALDSLDGRCRCPGSLKSAVRRRRHRRGRPPAERTSPRSVAGVAICRHGRQLLGVDNA